jgi:CHAD domain-containing protein
VAIAARIGSPGRTTDAQGRPHVTSEHLEVEAKYDVDEAFEVPDLSGLPGVASIDAPVEHHLEAVYFDTADLRLLRARVTMRRRTGGPDAGWHLKLPAGAARRELHAPLGRATTKPPPAVLRPVTGVVRGELPRPVATLRTRRVVTSLRGPDGDLLAEIADDTVTASVPPAGPGAPIGVQAWREVEVELGTGDDGLAAAIGERFVAGGARPSPSASKVGRVLGERLTAVAGPVPEGRTPANAGEFVLGALAGQVAALQAADVQLRTDQPDAVHQIRVAARRLRSTLAAFRSVLDPAATGPLRDELSWLGGQLADARDGEVACEHLRAVVAAQPEELVLGPVAARLQQTQIQEALAGSDRARLTLSERRYLDLLDALHGLLADPPVTARAGDGLRPVLRKATRRSVRKLRRRLRAARRAPQDGPSAALHDVRKAAKQLRYTAEVGRGELTHMKGVARAAKRAQKVLGELQDTVVTRELCRRLGVVASAAQENSFTYGRLHALEEARAERARRDFWALLPELRAVLRAG